MNFNNTTTVVDEDEGQAYDELWEFVIAEILYTIAASICIGSIVVLHSYLEKLHWLLKTLLTILCAHNFIMYLILAVTDTVMWVKGTEEINCGFSNVLGKSTIFITFEHTALVSFIRYHLASKTAANEEPNLVLISALTITLYLFKHVVNIISVVVSTTKFEVACLQDSSLEVNPMIEIGTGIIAVVVTCGGLVYDYNLVIMFLKQRNQLSNNGPMGTKLIPWKSFFEEYTFDIPIKASLASLILGIALSLMIILILPNPPLFVTFHIIGTVFPSVTLITLLGLTYRVRRLKNPLPAIPRRLHFHDQGEEEEDADEVYQVDQGLFHQGQMELDQFRSDSHSVAGDIIAQQLEKVNQKLVQHRQDNNQTRVKVIIVKPHNWNRSDLDIIDQVKEKLQFDDLRQADQRNKTQVEVEVHNKPSQNTLKDDDSETKVQNQDLDEEEPHKEPTDDELIQQEMEQMAKTEEMFVEEMERFNIDKDFSKPFALSEDESDEIILNPGKLLKQNVSFQKKGQSVNDSFDSEFLDFFAEPKGGKWDNVVNWYLCSDSELLRIQNVFQILIHQGPGLANLANEMENKSQN